MKKIFINFLVLFFITNFIYSQEFYFGLSPGEIIPVYSQFGDENFITYMDVYQVTGNFIFSVIFPNNLELETGIMYYNYPYRLRSTIDIGWLNKPNIFVGNPVYHAFSLPIHVGYKFKLAHRLYANIYSGLNFDFYFDPNNTEYMPYKHPGESWEERGWNIFGNLACWSEKKLQKQFNIMLTNRVSLQYFTKFNMGISLYASYYSGLRQVWKSTLHYTYDNGETIHKNIYLSRGSFWNFGIELGFKLGYKEQRKQAASLRKEQRKKIIELLNDW